MTTPTQTHDHEFIAAVEELFQDPEQRDAAEGGIHSTTVADHLSIHQSTAKQRLRDLAQRGEIAECDGLDPDTRRWRKSYAPVAEASGDETPRGGGRTVR